MTAGDLSTSAHGNRPHASAHRPLFIAAGTWAIVVIVLSQWGPVPDPVAPGLSWHAHEMLFGFAATGFAAYALTAMASWAGPGWLSRPGLVGVMAAWVVSRLAALAGAGDGGWLFPGASAAFMTAVSVILIHAALRARQRRGAILALFACGLTLGQVALLWGLIPPRLPLLLFALLLSMVGGRIVAAFTWNRVGEGASGHARARAARWLGLVSAAALAAILLMGATAQGHETLTPVLLLLAAGVEAGRLALWHARAVRQDGLLMMLHLGYAWLPIGLALVALVRLGLLPISETDAIHALAAGAVACAIYAMAARAVARRGEHLRPAVVDLVGFGLLWVAAVARVLPLEGAIWQAAAPVLWVAGWGLFLWRHGAALRQPAPRPVFSGPKHPRRTSGR